MISLMGFEDVSQPVFRIDEMITAEEIAVVLDGQRLAADLAADAFLGAIAEHLRNDVLELVDEDLAIVTFEPDIPDLGEEIAPVVRDRPTSR